MHPEKSLAELRNLLERIEASPRQRSAPPPPKRRKMGTALPPDAADEILAAYADGASAHALGERHGISAASVMRLVRARGVDVHERGMSDEDLARAIRLYESGLSVQKVADRLGYTKSMVLRHFAAAEVPMRRP